MAVHLPLLLMLLLLLALPAAGRNAVVFMLGCVAALWLRLVRAVCCGCILVMRLCWCSITALLCPLGSRLQLLLVLLLLLLGLQNHVEALYILQLIHLLHAHLGPAQQGDG
jgi:hypothetical protein